MMRTAVAATLVLATLALAGCSGGDAKVTTDLITPGVWDIRGDTDHVMAWAHNSAGDDKAIRWSLTGAAGTSLPQGWNVSFGPVESQLAKEGSKVPGSRGYSYPDWAMTLITVKLPADQPAGTFDLILHAGPAQRAVKVTVHDGRSNVSGPGSVVEVHYEGRFHDSGEVFDAGDFPRPITLGQGATVPGFDHGLMGLAAGETAVISIPPAFGYGYDATGNYARFNGKTLDFTVTLTSLQG